MAEREEMPDGDELPACHRFSFPLPLLRLSRFPPRNFAGFGSDPRAAVLVPRPMTNAGPAMSFCFDFWGLAIRSPARVPRYCNRVAWT